MEDAAAPVAELLAAAVATNAHWCAEVCPPDPGAATPGVQLAAAPPHPWFPDLVTCRPGWAARDLAALVTGRRACSVKDSYSDVDLAPWGFDVLLDARWIAAPPVRPGRSGQLSPVSTASELAAWCSTAGLPVSLPAGLLTSATTTVLARGTAGAVATCSDGAVGVSNVVGSPAVDIWPALRATLGDLHPGLPMVGYEHGEDLRAAMAAGFIDLGPLRVWSRSTDGPGRPAR